MPNPRAQRQLTLDRVVSDLKSFAEPAQAMGDMMAGALRGSVAATGGLGGDFESLGRGAISAFNAPSGKRLEAFGAGMEQPTFLPTTERVSAMLPSAVPQGAPASRQHTAGVYSDIGEMLPLPKSGVLAKGAMYGLGRGAGALTRGAGKAINDAMVYNQGPLAKGSLSFLAPQTATMHVVKPEGGNWTGGELMNSVDRSLKRLTTPTVAGQTPAERIPLHEQALNDPTVTPEGREIINRHLNETKGEAALDKWITQNLGNYVKKQMATPNDPVRLMFEKRVQEVESKFSKDMERVNRTRERAQQEADPRRQANLMREADRLELDAQAGRDLAMKHITHLPADEIEMSANYIPDKRLQEQRQKAGFNPMGEAKSAPAKAWENNADAAIETRRAGDIQEALGIMPKAQELTGKLLQKEIEIDQKFRKYLEDKNVLTPDQLESVMDKMSTLDKAHLIGEGEEFGQLRAKQAALQGRLSGNDFVTGEHNAWIAKLDPEAPLYSGDIYNLGFDHVIDVLKQDVREGRIRPDQLNKVSVEQAIKRTADFDMEQAKKMAETAIKQQEGFPVHKEYPEGYKWIELKAPPALTELPPTHELEPYESKVHGGTAYRVINKETGMRGEGYKTPERAKSEFLKEHSEERLADALKYEGDTMGHCVGGYCPDVISGKSRIYSLRDPRGEPHVTVEVNPRSASLNDFSSAGIDFKGVREEAMRRMGVTPETEADFMKNLNGDQRYQAQDVLNKHIDDIYKEQFGNLPQSIRQIKGKQNLAPKEQYLPYVQDFVRSGNWSDVGDFQNTGLIRRGNVFTPTEKQGLIDLGQDVPEYLTQEDIARLRRARGDLPPEEGMKKGGKVSISDNCDCQHMEVMDKHMAGGGGLSKVAIEALERMKALKPEFQARANLLNKYKAETASIPYNEVKPFQMTNEQIREEMDRMAREQAQREQNKAKGGAVEKLIKLARAPAKSKEEIRAVAERIAPQMTGEYVRKSPTKAETISGKTQKQFEREKDLPVDIRPTGEVKTPQKIDIESLKGSTFMGIPGDYTVTGKTLHGVGDVKLDIPSPQHGGPLYGLYHDDAHFWASEKDRATTAQNLAKTISQQYESPVIGNYIMMGPEGMNYAQHFADANLQAIDLSKMSKRDIEKLNKAIREGSDESGRRDSFPGIEDKGSAYLWFSQDPALRKHFNQIMQKESIAKLAGLPSGYDVRFAVTEPELRDLERGVTGFSMGQMLPDIPAESLRYSEHPTYSHDIPGHFLGQSKYPIPYELSFPDTVKAIRENPRQAPHEFGTLQYIGARQPIDQQLIDEIKQYEEMMKSLTGKKKGGEVKKASGGEITGDDLIIEERPL